MGMTVLAATSGKVFGLCRLLWACYECDIRYRVVISRAAHPIDIDALDTLALEISEF